MNNYQNRRVRHINAKPSEWVRVHRPAPAPSSHGDAIWGLIFKIGLSIAAFFIVCEIIKAMLPLILIGGAAWFWLKLNSK